MEAKKSYWTESFKSEVSESKDMYKILKTVKEMKNGYKLQAYPIKLDNNDFPSRQDKAEAFVNMFAENSWSTNLNPSIIKFKKEEEQKEEYKDAIPKQCHYLNSPLQYDECIETLKSFASNTTAVGIDGIYIISNAQPFAWQLETAIIYILPKMLVKWDSS